MSKLSDFAFVAGTPYDPFAPFPYTSFDGYNLTCIDKLS